MEEQKKHMDDLFRQQLSDYQEAPRSGMWDRIEGNLDKIDATKAPGGKNPGGARGLMGYSIIILLIVAAAFFIYKQSSKSIEPDKAASANSTVKETGKESTTAAVKIDEAQNTDNSVAATANKAAHTNNGVSNNASGQVNSNTQNNSETNIAVKHATKKAHTANRLAKRNNKTAQESAATNNNSVAAINKNGKNNVDDREVARLNSPVTKAESINANAASTTASTHKHEKKQPNASKHSKEVTTAQTNTETVTTATAAPKVGTSKHTKPKPAFAKKDADSSNAVAPVLSSMAAPEKKSGEHTGMVNATLPKEKKRKHSVASALNKKKILNTTVKTSAPANAALAKQSMPAIKPASSAANKSIATAEKKTEPTTGSPKIAAIPPANKPVAPEKTKTNSSLKQDVETTKPELAAKENVTTGNIDSSTKNNPAGSGSGGSDIATNTVNTFSLQAGVKLGYEQGFSTYTTSKFVGAVYAQIALSDKIGILFQPAIKYTQLNKNINNGSKSYYNNTGKQYDSTHVSGTPGYPDSLSAFKYYGTYDSIIINQRNTSTSYIGFEIPVLLKYKISNSLSLLGGVNIDISNLFAIGDYTNTNHLKTGIDSIAVIRPGDFHSFLDSLTYRHPGTPYSSYTPLNASTQSTVRIGYMFGIDYLIADKVTFEFLMTQSLSGYNNITDKNIKGLYSQPYFRLSIGYRFLNITRKKIPYNGGL